MAFESIKKLTIIELLAIAQIKYGGDRFIANDLAKYVSLLFSVPFKVSTNNDVVKWLEIAESEKLVRQEPGPRGGIGFKTTPAGAAVAGELEFPEALIERRQRLDDEKVSQAKENAAPIFLNLLSSLPEDAVKERSFVSDIWQQWLARGWLSSKQAHSVAEIGLNFGIYINRSLYVGAAQDEWRVPYIEAQRKRFAEQRLLARQRLAEIEQKRRAQIAAQAAIREKNRRVAATLKSDIFAVKLSGLEEFVTQIFPETNLSKGSLTAAYSGGGAKALRICISALAYGLPPSKVWENSASHVQPDESSDIWKVLIEHEAYRTRG